MSTISPKFIVGIGGSAGGLMTYKDFLDELSPRTGMAFVIVSHILPTATSQLAEILSEHSKMAVSVISETISIEENHVYVCPPNADLKHAGRYLSHFLGFGQRPESHRYHFLWI